MNKKFRNLYKIPIDILIQDDIINLQTQTKQTEIITFNHKRKSMLCRPALFPVRAGGRSYMTESAFALPTKSRFSYSSKTDTRLCFTYQLSLSHRIMVFSAHETPASPSVPWMRQVPASTLSSDTYSTRAGLQGKKPCPGSILARTA